MIAGEGVPEYGCRWRENVIESGGWFLSHPCATIEHMFDNTDVLDRPPAARMRGDLAELASDDYAEWSTDGLSTRLVGLLELRERLDTELARVTVGWRHKRAWEAGGALSAVAWMTHRAPVAPIDARRLVKNAKILNDSPRLAEALAGGGIAAGHVGALAGVVSPRRRALFRHHDEVLVKQARRLSLKDFTLVARRWAAIADDHLATDSHQEHESRNELYGDDGRLDRRHVPYRPYCRGYLPGDPRPSGTTRPPKTPPRVERPATDHHDHWPRLRRRPGDSCTRRDERSAHSVCEVVWAG